MIIQIFVLLLFQSVISISEEHLRKNLDGEYRIIHDFYAEVDSKRKRRASFSDLKFNQTSTSEFDSDFDHFFTFQFADSSSLRFAATLDSKSDSGCKFYSGRVVGKEDSSATLSDCGLWSGLIHLDDELWILDHLEDSNLKRHVIYRLDDDVNSVLSTKNANSLSGDTFDFIPSSHSRSRRGAAATRSNSLATRQRSPKATLKVTIEVTVGDDLVQHYHKIAEKKTNNDAAGREYSLEKYIDALILYTNTIYKHPSLDSRFQFVRVGEVQKLDKRETDSIMSYNGAQETLMEFCRHSGKDGFTPFWKPGYSSAQDEVKHASILLTRRPFGPAGNNCKGMATIDKICSPNPYSKTECPGAIVIEEGVATAFVIAHELGHLLGIRTHDGDPGNACGDAIGENSMMAAQVNSKFGSFTWSICSNRDLTKAYNEKGAQCLTTVPTIVRPGLRHENQMVVRNTAPVVDYTTFTADQQCQQTFGAEWSRCPEGQYPSESKFCQNLWCKTPENPALCRTKDAPAERTPCPLGGGQEGTCFSGTCLGNDIGSYKQSKNGYFSNWSSWSTCSVDCGTGTRLRTRRCSTGNSLGCEGDDTDFIVCNTHECDDSKDKRVEACRMKTGNGNMIPFVPTHNDDSCKLSCKVYGSDPEIIWPNKNTRVREEEQYVPDGTFCDYRVPHGGICVQGKCQQVDCEGRRGGRKQVDECGVCGGDGSQCQEQRGAETVKGKSKRTTTKKIALTIPANAYRIVISVKARTRYYKIFFTDKQSSKEYQMWPLEERSRKKRRVEFGHEAAIGGAQFSVNPIQSGRIGKSPRNRKRRSPRMMPSIRTEGQSRTLSEIQVEVEVTKGKRAKKGVRISYQYNIHRSAIETAQTDFEWSHHSWKPCPSNCALKNRMRKPLFVCKSRRSGARLADEYCNMLKKPKTPRPEQCPKCPTYEWSAGKWGECPIDQCGDNRYKHRNIYCRNKFGDIIDNQLCANLQKPAESLQCPPKKCTSQWHAGSFSSCSASCGDGEKERSVECRRGNVVVGDEQCKKADMPRRIIHCFVPCKYEDTCINKSDTCISLAKYDFGNLCRNNPEIAKMCCASCRAQGRGKTRLKPRYTYEDVYFSPDPNEDAPDYYNSDYDMSEEDIVNPNENIFSRKRRSGEKSSSPSFSEEYRDAKTTELHEQS